MNRFGVRLVLGLWGESHGPAVGGVLDGVPPGTPVDLGAVQRDLEARKPGGPLASQRQEPDRLEVLSGVHQGRATGAPLAFLLRNADARPQDYGTAFRPSHGDWPGHAASLGFADLRGGGHGSGRLTAPLVAAGSIVRPLLAAHGIHAAAVLSGIGDLDEPVAPAGAAGLEEASRALPVPAADAAAARRFAAAIEEARRGGDSVGGRITFLADGVPAGLGDPFFAGLEPQLAQILLAVPAVVGVEFGDGFGQSRARGSANNDPLRLDGAGLVRPASNHGGGLAGGRTTGAPVWGRVAVKPASSIALPQQTVARDGGEATVTVRGRHDPCIAVRATPVVAACLRLALADAVLGAQATGLLAAPRWPAVLQQEAAP